MSISNNTTKLQSLINKINALPEAGAGIEAHNTDTTAHADIRAEILNGAGKNVTGTQYTISGQNIIAGENAEIFNDYIDNKASGEYSHSEGYKTAALADYAHAEGWRAIATDYASHAEGAGALASGGFSHAEGVDTVASSYHAHAEGSNTIACSESAHSEGSYTIASGGSSHAEGEGRWITSIHITGKADSTIYSIETETSENIISGMKVKRFCTVDNVWDYQSYHTIVNYNEQDKTLTLDYPLSYREDIDEDVSIVYFGIADGQSSHSEGEGTIANSRAQHSQGRYNIPDTGTIGWEYGTYAHIVGNGESPENLSNAHTLDWDGNAWFAGDVYVGSTSGVNKDDGSKKLATIDEVNTAISAIPTPDVSGQITTHNTSDSAHNDIRELVSELTVRLNTLADSDDTTLDQISEIVNYIKNNKSLIEGVTTNKVNVADIVDNLTTDVADKPLSAGQGVALKSLIDTSIEEVETNIKPYIFNIDYNTLLAFDTSEIVFDNSGNTSTSSILGKAILGKMILA